MQDPDYARAWQEMELARRLGMRQPDIARLEAGQHAPSFRTLARLAAVLEVELNLRITPDGFQLTA